MASGWAESTCIVGGWSSHFQTKLGTHPGCGSQLIHRTTLDRVVRNPVSPLQRISLAESAYTTRRGVGDGGGVSLGRLVQVPLHAIRIYCGKWRNTAQTQMLRPEIHTNLRIPGAILLRRAWIPSAPHLSAWQQCGLQTRCLWMTATQFLPAPRPARAPPDQPCADSMLVTSLACPHRVDPWCLYSVQQGLTEALAAEGAEDRCPSSPRGLSFQAWFDRIRAPDDAVTRIVPGASCVKS